MCARNQVFPVVACLVWASCTSAQSTSIPSTHSIPSAHVVSVAPTNGHTPGKLGPGEFPSLISEANAVKEAGDSSSTTPLVTVVSSLAIVLGLFAGLVCLTRKFGNGAVRAGSMPGDVLANLGSTAIDAKTRVMMLRCGSRIVVVAQTASGVHPLCEISDPHEVQELTKACMGESHPTFQQSLAAAQQRVANEEPKRKRLFATA